MTTPLRMTIDVSDDSGMILPLEMRDTLGLAEGGKVVLIQDENGIRITTQDRIVERVRALAAPYLSGHGSIADEFIAERRAEAARDEAEEAAHSVMDTDGIARILARYPTLT